MEKRAGQCAEIAQKLRGKPKSIGSDRKIGTGSVAIVALPPTACQKRSVRWREKQQTEIYENKIGKQWTKSAIALLLQLTIVRLYKAID